LIIISLFEKKWSNDYNFVDLIEHEKIVETLAKHGSRDAIKLVETIRYCKIGQVFILFIIRMMFSTKYFIKM
jgi:hypothetical protein